MGYGEGSRGCVAGPKDVVLEPAKNSVWGGEGGQATGLPKSKKKVGEGASGDLAHGDASRLGPEKSVKRKRAVGKKKLKKGEQS